MIVIGITGTLGAGKGTIVEYLTQKKGFLHFSVRAFLLDEIRLRGLSSDRDIMFTLANSLRAEHGSSFVTDQLYLRAVQSNKNCVIESIRTPGEILSLRKSPCFYLFAIDAKPETRYRRILLRQSETDAISFETFLENEKREMNTSDPNKQNLHECIAMADFIFNNDGKKDELFLQVESVLSSIPKEQ